LKARALNFLAVRGGALSRQLFEEARAAARAALALKPDLASARAAMAYIYIFGDWNFAAAEAELNAVRQKDASALNNLGTLRAIQGRLDETIALRQEAVRLEPLYADFHRIIGNSLVRVGRLDEAEAAFLKALELQPETRQAHGPLALLALLRGDLDRALKETELQRDPGGMGTAIVRFARGEREEADAALQALIKTHADRAVSIAAVYAFRGEADQMFDWLNRAYDQREPTLVSSLGAIPFFMRYYSDPRFVELCRKTGVALPK
jgi:superkiller protein 3